MKINQLSRWLAAWFLAAGSLAAFAQPLRPFEVQTNGVAYVPGEILIKFKPEAPAAQVRQAMQMAGTSDTKRVHTRAMQDEGSGEITRARIVQPVDRAIQTLQRHPAVEHVQPNWVYTHQADAPVVNDPYFGNGSLWGMYGSTTLPANAYGSGATAAWAAGSTGSESVYVGIVDEGIQYGHPDLAGNMWVNAAESNGTAGKDDDANGYVDDIYGWNAINDSGDIYDAASDDHGTHVAGTIGAVGNNGLGVVGVNLAVTMVSGKFLGPQDGTTADAIQAIDYMTFLKTRKGLNVVALNNSWSGGAYDALLLASIVRAAKAQILFVAAAGNGNAVGRAINTDSTPVYPACYNTTSGAGYDAVIAVTAIDATGAKPSWANYGAKTVDLGAPGVNILSTVPSGGYAAYSGTSMAAPHVAGAIALYAARYPTASAQQIRNALLTTTTATASMSQTVTKGRLDITKFLSVAPPGWTPDPSSPAPPSAFSATADTYNQIELAWTDNSGNETEFVITRIQSGSVSATIHVPANLTSYTDTGLAEKTEYSYTLCAVNSAGASATLSAKATTLAAPVPAIAEFVGTDTATRGNWVGVYGNQAYDIVSYESLLPGYAITPSGLINTWAASTTDTRALLIPNKSSRSATCYYSIPAYKVGSYFTVEVSLPAGATRNVALYCLDWEATARNQTVRVIDYNTGAELDIQTIQSFGSGVYLIWKITGQVVFKISNNTSTAGNAVVSGIFVDETAPQADPPAPTSLTAKALSRSQIGLTWTDTSGGKAYFEIERSTSESGTFTRIATTATTGVTSYTSSGLSANTTYYYKVRALSVQNGLYSTYATANATTPRR